MRKVYIAIVVLVAALVVAEVVHINTKDNFDLWQTYQRQKDRIELAGIRSHEFQVFGESRPFKDAQEAKDREAFRRFLQEANGLLKEVEGACLHAKMIFENNETNWTKKHAALDYAAKLCKKNKELFHDIPIHTFSASPIYDRAKDIRWQCYATLYSQELVLDYLALISYQTAKGTEDVTNLFGFFGEEVLWDKAVLRYSEQLRSEMNRIEGHVRKAKALLGLE